MAQSWVPPPPPPPSQPPPPSNNNVMPPPSTPPPPNSSQSSTTPTSPRSFQSPQSPQMPNSYTSQQYQQIQQSTLSQEQFDKNQAYILKMQQKRNNKSPQISSSPSYNNNPNNDNQNNLNNNHQHNNNMNNNNNLNNNYNNYLNHNNNNNNNNNINNNNNNNNIMQKPINLLSTNSNSNSNNNNNNNNNNPEPLKKKISLFGDGFLEKAKIKDEPVVVQKKNKKKLELPSSAVSEIELFQKYRIEGDKIGQGAFARIKVVRRKDDNKKYALKMIKKKGKTNADILALTKEIIFLSKCDHPNVIKLLDFCDSQKGVYMVLEFCDGGDVMNKLTELQKFDEVYAKSIIKQVANGLVHIHNLKIVHRDLKMDNLMYESNNKHSTIKIIDFGLAGDASYGPLNTSCGTAHYTAPEVLSGYDYDAAADLWSLGVITYTLLAGFPPFFDNQSNEQRLIAMIKKGRFQFTAPFFDNITKDAKDFICKLLQKQPKQRMTAEEVLKHVWIAGYMQYQPPMQQQQQQQYQPQQYQPQQQQPPYQYQYQSYQPGMPSNGKGKKKKKKKKSH